MAKVKSQNRSKGSRKRPARQKNRNFQITANVKGRHHQKRIGGRMFYWNSSEFSPEEAGLVAASLKQKYRELKQSPSPQDLGKWDDDFWLASVRNHIERYNCLGPFKKLNSPDSLGPSIQTSVSRSAFKENLPVFSNDLTQLEIKILIGIYLAEVKKSSASNKRHQRALKARLNFGLSPFLTNTMRDIDANWLERVAESINERKSTNGDFYKYNYRRDALSAVKLFISFLQTNQDFRKHLSPLPDLTLTLRAKIRNTQQSLREDDRFVEWDERTLKRYKSEINTLIVKSDPNVRAFVLLAINCGYLTSEIGHLTNAFLEDGVIRWFRPKSINRSPKPPKMIHYLWPETQIAIEAVRNKDRSSNAPLFVNTLGNGVHENDFVGKAFRGFAKELGLKWKFKDLRKLSATLVEHLSEQSGLSSFHLGHTSPSVSYKHYVNPEEPFSRLRKVTDKIRTHLDIHKIAIK